MRRKTSVIATAAALAMGAAGTMLGIAAPAQAAPGNCTVSAAGNPVYSLCTTGTGHHRVHMVLNALDPRLPQRIILGDWAPVGQKSVATNPWGSSYVVSVWVDRVDW